MYTKLPLISIISLILLNLAAPANSEPYNFIPEYIGYANEHKNLSWWTNCHHINTLSVRKVEDEKNQVLEILLEKDSQSHPLCSDVYTYGTISKLQFFDTLGPNLAKLEIEYPYDYEKYGIRIFRFQDGIIKSMADIYETFELFIQALTGNSSVDEKTAELNIEFLRTYMNYPVESKQKFIQNKTIDTTDLHPGDFLGILRLDGLDPLVCWGTGSIFGHTATIMKINNQKYVVESQNKSNYWPNNNIQKTPIDTWLDMARSADYHVVHLPLSRTNQDKIKQREQELKKWFSSVEGNPYGINNFIFGWLDTPQQNFPHPLSSEFLTIAMSLIDPLLQDRGIPSLWNQGIKHRLNIDDKTEFSTRDLLEESLSKGIDYQTLLAIPEDDKWLYNNAGQITTSMVCNVFVCNIYREAGILNTNFNCTETTPFDVTEFNIYNGTYTQLMGTYQIEMEKWGRWNRAKIFENMRQNCPSQAPNYTLRNEQHVIQTC